MALILNIETSTTACSVALAEHGHVLAAKSINNGYSHAENLAVFVKEVLEQAGKKAEELEAIAVSRGPGSYTGLRIGVATAKGLAYAQKIPLIAVDTLRSMVVGIQQKQTVEEASEVLYCPMLDARRMEVYSSVFDAKRVRLEAIKAVVIDEGSYFNFLDKKKVCFFGPGAEKCIETLGKHPNASFIGDYFPQAEHMAELAEKAFEAKRFEETAYFEPFYLKDFIAGKPKSML